MRFIRFASIILAAATLAGAAQAAETQKSHALAMHGEPKYPADYKHFDYVNPLAPKGGDVKLAATGTFDSFNAFIIKGNPAAEEFVVSLHPQTEDQFLGSVRQSAAKLKELREDEDQNGHALRDLLEMLLRDPDANVGDDLEDYLAERDEDAAATGGKMNGKAGGAD